MAIAVTCPKGHYLRLKDKYAGMSGFCPHCSARVDVPRAEPLLEDDVLAIMGHSSSPNPAEEVVHQEPSPREQSGISLLGSSVLREKAACLQCGKLLPAAFAVCPQCNTPLSPCVVSMPKKKPK